MRMITGIGTVAIVMMTVACGGPSKDEMKAQAITNAKDALISIANSEMTGPMTEVKVNEIYNTLSGADLSLDSAGIKESTLVRLTHEAYGRDARKSLTNLQRKKGSPEDANSLRAKFVREMQMSGMTYADFGTNDAELARIVSKNALEFIKASGGNPQPADYQAAGLPVPTIVKTRTVVRRVPETKAKPSAHKKTSTRRRVG